MVGVLYLLGGQSVTRPERDAMGDDEYHPIGHSGTNLTDAGGIGYTVVDSIDTMLLMGLDEEYERARKWVAEQLSFDRDANFNTFEVRRLQTDALVVAHLFLDDYTRPWWLAIHVPLHEGRYVSRTCEGPRGPYDARLRDPDGAPAFDGQPRKTRRSS